MRGGSREKHGASFNRGSKDIMKNTRNTMLVSFGVAAIAAMAMTACGSDKTEPGKDTGHTAAPAQTSAPAAVTNAPAATTAPAATSSAITNAPAPAATGPNGRSAVPTLDEWNAASDVTVKGSSKLGCETRMVREWLRVSCRGKNATGGEPSNVTLKKGGGHGDTFTFARNKVASLVCPFVDGTDIVAEFEWTDSKHELVVSWPHGAPTPPSKGEFR